MTLNQFNIKRVKCARRYEYLFTRNFPGCITDHSHSARYLDFSKRSVNKSESLCICVLLVPLRALVRPYEVLNGAPMVAANDTAFVTRMCATDILCFNRYIQSIDIKESVTIAR